MFSISSYEATITPSFSQLVISSVVMCDVSETALLNEPREILLRLNAKLDA